MPNTKTINQESVDKKIDELLLNLNLISRLDIEVQTDFYLKAREQIKKLIPHEHEIIASRCEEGCGCDLLHLSCKIRDCDWYQLAEGWDNCNVQWEFWLEEDINHLKELTKST